jgi:hypothetical protein
LTGDTYRSILKPLYLKFTHEESSITETVTPNIIGRNVNAPTYYVVPICRSMYTEGPEYDSAWLTATLQAQYPLYFNKELFNSATQSSTAFNLIQYIETVTDYFIDPTTRVCYQGKFCYNCLVPKFPGYEVATSPDTDTSIMLASRGDLRIIELSLTNYGFSYVSNSKSELQFSTSSWDTTVAHAARGNTRQSFGNFYIQNTAGALNTHDIYALHDVSAVTFAKIYTTTEAIKAHTGWDKAIWWPTKNFFLVRQFGRVMWDGFGLNILSVEVSVTPASYLPNQQFEPFSTGPIAIDGEMPLDAVFTNDYLTLYRTATLDGNNYLSMYSWTPGHFKKEHERAITGTVTSLVSFGTDGVLLWKVNEKSGTFYDATGSAGAAISVEITDTAHAATWTAQSLSSTDFRLIQARPAPKIPAQNPTVYAFFENYRLFTVTLDLANTKIVLSPVVELDSRFNLYQPLDIGHFHLANMIVHPCTMPTSDTDIYTSSSVMFYELGSASTTQCIQLTTAETKFD